MFWMYLEENIKLLVAGTKYILSVFEKFFLAVFELLVPVQLKKTFSKDRQDEFSTRYKL